MKTQHQADAPSVQLGGERRGQERGAMQTSVALLPSKYAPGEEEEQRANGQGEIARGVLLVLTVGEAAFALGISQTLAYEPARQGKLPTLRLGRRLVVPKAALERLLEEVGQKRIGGSDA